MARMLSPDPSLLPAAEWIRVAALNLLVAWVEAPNTQGSWPVDKAIDAAIKIWVDSNGSAADLYRQSPKGDT